MVNQTPTPASKNIDDPKLFGDLSGARGRLSRPIWRGSLVRAEIKNICLQSLREVGCLEAVWPDLFGATKWRYNLYAGLIVGACGIVRRAPSF